MNSLESLTHAALMFADSGCPEIEEIVDWVRDGEPQESSICSHLATCRRCDAERVLAAQAFAPLEVAEPVSKRPAGEQDGASPPANGLTEEALARVTARVEAAIGEFLRGPATMLSFESARRRNPWRQVLKQGSPWLLAAALLVTFGLSSFLLRDRLASPPPLSLPTTGELVRGAALEVLEVRARDQDEGGLRVEWLAETGATEYRLQVERVDGSLVETITTAEPWALLSRSAGELAAAVRLRLRVETTNAQGQVVTGPVYWLEPGELGPALDTQVDPPNAEPPAADASPGGAGRR